MSKKIPIKTRISAVNDYVRSGKSLKEVASVHGISGETLRKWLGDYVRPVGKSEKVSSGSSHVNKKENLRNSNRRWRKIEEEGLLEAVHSGMSVKETSELLERTEASIQTRKSVLASRGLIEKRFISPKGIKRTTNHREPLVEPTVIQNTTEHETPIKEVPEVDLDAITNLSLERLASVVSRFGVSLSINISEGLTSVQMSKL